MRVAVVSQLNSPGGGSRFLRGLLLELPEQPDPVEEVGLVVDAAAIGRDGLQALLESHDGRVTIHTVDASGTLPDTPVETGAPGTAAFAAPAAAPPRRSRVGAADAPWYRASCGRGPGGENRPMSKVHADEGVAVMRDSLWNSERPRAMAARSRQETGRHGCGEAALGCLRIFSDAIARSASFQAVRDPSCWEA